jgi:predicted Zn finger-like uncharacterized protein
MIVQCPSCETKFRIADGKVAQSGVKVRCSKCAQVFVVRKDPSAASLESISAGVALGLDPPAPRPETPPLGESPGLDGDRGPPEALRSVLPPPEPPDRLSGTKDPFAFDASVPAAPPVPAVTEVSAPPPLPSALGNDDTLRQALEQAMDAEPDPDLFGLAPLPEPGPPSADHDPFLGPDGPRFGAAPSESSPTIPEPDLSFGAPEAGGAPRFPPPPDSGADDTPSSPFAADFDSSDPFAADPFVEPPSVLELPPTEPSPFEAPLPPSPSPNPPPARTASGAAIQMGRVAPLGVSTERSEDLEPKLSKGPLPVPELKWPPRVGFVLGLALSVLWLRPASLDWAEAAIAGEDVRTVELEARPYALDLDAPVWLVSGKAQTRGTPYPGGLEARVRVRSGGVLVADVQVPVGVVPPVDVIADGEEALEAYWRETPRPPLGAATRTPFLVVLPPVRSDPESLRIEVEYVPASVDPRAAAPPIGAP